MPPPPEPDAVSSTSADATGSQPDGPSETRPGGSRPALPAPHPTTLGGYRIEGLLGEGGMGAVYLARDDQLDRAVALKTMRPEVAAQPGASERFLREARAAAKVAHDNIIPILHIGEDAGTPYIVMPLLEGEPLNKFLKRVPVCPVAVVLKVGRETADGLAAAHARGLVHREIKPANIWIEGDATSNDFAARFRRVKVLDFGLARPAKDDTQLTGTGAILGTPAYMSPEQGRGQPVDFRTDLFSLGVLLYRMTTGVAPFTGDSTMAILTSLAVDNPPPPITKNPEVPQALSDLIMCLLAKDRDDRPKSTAGVAAALREIGKQIVAARQAALVPPTPSGPLPVVVYPQPLVQPVAPQYNPFTELDASEVQPGSDVPETTVAQPKAVTEPKAKKPRGAGLWVAAGLVSLVAVAAVVFAVAKLAGPKEKVPTPNPNEVAKDEPKQPAPPPQPRTDPDREVAVWVLAVGGKVTVKTSGGENGVAAAKDLSAGPLIVTALDLSFTGERVTDTDLGRLKGLTGLTTLNLDNAAPITDAGVIHLKQFKGLSYLNLAGTKVTDAGVIHLKGLMGLSYLNLAGTKVTNEGVEHLKGLKDLRILHFSETPVTDAGVEHLEGLLGLTNLGLVRTQVTDVGVEHLQKLERLTHLYLSGTQVTDAGLEHLKGLGTLTVLTLQGTKVTATGVAKLAKALPNCKITSDHGTIEPAGDRAAAEWVLSFGGTVRIEPGGDKVLTAIKELPAGPVTLIGVDTNGRGGEVTDTALARLGGAKKLVGLYLHSTKVTDAGLVHLKGLTELRLLWLQNTGVSDVGLEHLTGLDKLGELNLTNTKVTAAGVAKLAKALPNCKITSDRGTIEPAGDRAAALWVLSVGGRVTLKLGGGEKEFSPGGKPLPVEPLTITQISLTSSGKVATDAGLANLKGLTALTVLELSSTGVTDAGLEHLANSQALTRLTLGGTQVTGPGLVHLKGMKALADLDLTSTKVTDDNLVHLTGLTSLRHLGLKGTKITGAGLEHLAGLTGLTNLYLTGTAVTDTGLAHLQGLAHLTALTLHDTRVTGAGLEHLAGMTKLAELDLAGTPVTDAGVAHLKGLKELTRLNLSVTKVTDEGLAHLKGITGLMSLQLSHTGVTDAWLEHLAGFDKLIGLNLSNTKVTPAGVEKLQKALPKCKVEWTPPKP